MKPQSVKILYFAWVREKTGKAEEVVDLPAEVGTVAELIAWLKGAGPSTPRPSPAARSSARPSTRSMCRRRRASPARARSPSSRR